MFQLTPNAIHASIPSEMFHRKKKELPPLDDLDEHSVTTLFASQYPTVACPRDAAATLFSKPLPSLRSRIDYEISEHEITEDELDFAAGFGRFPCRPSELFLRLFHNALTTLRRDPLCGRVSPSLIGSSGVIPLSIISTIPDIMQHYYHSIVHAEREVLLATNYWEKGNSVTIIGKALRDLSRRAQEDNRSVVFKLIIDHPTKENLAHYHSILPPEKWAHYDIPEPHEIPNISLEINNYHRIIMGTFHSKFMVVDRRFALLNSNNIQDRPNVEMMTHLEGDIVNSLYDTFLISWWIPFNPNPVCLYADASSENNFEFGPESHRLMPFQEPLVHAVARARIRLQQHMDTNQEKVYFQEPILAQLSHCPLAPPEPSSPSSSEKSSGSLTDHLNQTAESAYKTKPAENLPSSVLERLGHDFTPFIFHQPHEPFPMALVNRSPRGLPGHIDEANPQDAAWLGAFRYAKNLIFMQSPTLNAVPIIEGIELACRRRVRVVLWLDLGFNDSKEGHGTLQGGTNEHVIKKLYKKLKDGGDGAEQFLETYWYTGKDQIRPLNFSQQSRNCHIKFMSIDGQVAIMGNGNLDSQSYYHSQEINVMIDSPLIVKEWMEALYKNQSTNEYGKLDLDGIWRDREGHENPHNGK